MWARGQSPRRRFTATVLAAVSMLSIGTLGEAQTAAELVSQGDYRGALELTERQLAADPDDASAHYHRGRALTGLLRYRDAALSLERAVGLAAGHDGALVELVVVYGQLGETEDARRAFETLGSLDGLGTEPRLRLARALRKIGASAEARSVLASVPELPKEGHAELGLSAAADGDCDQALRHLELAGTGAPIALARGRCLESLERPDEAIEQYREALSADDKLAPARFRLGNLLLRGGAREEALALLEDYETFRQWERRVKLLLAMVSSGTLPADDTRVKTLELIDLYLQGGETDEAARMIASGLERFPDDPAMRTARTRWQLATGDVDAARTTLDELLQLPEPPADALWLSARLHLNDGQAAEALALYERFIARVSSPPAVLLKELATAHAILGNAPEAIELFERAIASDPRLAAARADLGLMLESAGRIDEAASHYRAALAIDPALVSAQQGLGSLLLERGELVAAEKLFRRSTELAPADPALRRNLALVLSRLGRDDDAAAELQLARKLERPPRP